MKIVIETNLKNDTNQETETWSVLLDMEQLAGIVKNGGLDAGNQALEGFVAKYVQQFKERFGKYVNK
jgi:hypothetical protein